MYLAYLNQEIQVVESTAVKSAPAAKIVHRYDVIIGGVSMLVPADQVDALAGLPGVKAVYPDELLQVDTFYSPQFIGAPTTWNKLGGQGKAGEGVIVGVIDTGIWPEHPAFSDPDPLGKAYAPPPASWTGTTCDFGSADPIDPPFACNNKLIGAYRFMATYDLFGPAPLPGEVFSARDTDGHGTHTSSTAAGNRGVQANIFGNPLATVSGIAPRAHVVAYKVCGGLPGIGGCFGSDSAAAIQQAIVDGVDVLNFSISGGSNPYSDIVSLAFLDAYNAGIFVAASAGNTGPGANTVNHREPWVATVGASTTDQALTGTGTINLTADGGAALSLNGFALDNGLATSSPVVLSSAAPYSNALCGAPAAPGTFTGKIVACQRGTFPLVTKVANVAAGGAVGAIIYNPAPQAIPVVVYKIPTVHIDAAEGTALQNFVNTNTNVQATFSPAVISTVAQAGDVMGSFSSRGGSAQPLGISKPDVTAPGVGILAGYTPSPFDPTSPSGLLFNFLQGTSMSSPHVAGSAALLADLYPGWTPGQIKSALMTSAKASGLVKEDGVTPFTPFDAGSGRIDLRKAWDPGLTISDSGANYLAHQNDLWNANYPSLYVPVMPGLITVQRTVQEVSGYNDTWRFQVQYPSGQPSDFKVIVPKSFFIKANKTYTFNITVDARDVPLGQVRHATVLITNPSGCVVRFPVTIVRQQPVVTMEKVCDPATFPKGSTTNCTITITNTSTNDANVSFVDKMPKQLDIVSGSVVGATKSGNTLTFNGTLAGAAPPDVSLAPGSTPAGGYLPLSLFGVGPIAGMGDDTIVNFGTPPFTYGGETYTTLGVSSNGYLVVGGGSGPDNSLNNQNFPNPTRPNNVIAAFWTDLNPAVAGAVRIATLTDGLDTWIVVDWDAVREFSTATNTHSFEIWIGVNGDTNPGEDVSIAYGPNTGTGDLGFASVGVENRFGNRGNNTYFNGVGTLPTNGTELRVSSTPPVPGGAHVITFQAKGVKVGQWVNYAELTGDLWQGTSIARFAGEVLRP
jgi:uncharacterized repeat protein (TIGR01451 family)